MSQCVENSKFHCDSREFHVLKVSRTSALKNLRAVFIAFKIKNYNFFSARYSPPRRISQVVKLLFAHKTLLAQYAIVIKLKLSSRRWKNLFQFVFIFFVPECMIS